MLFLQLFYAFFKIGLFGFGGGYAMISMIQGEVVTRHEWLTSTEFTDIIAISQMTPGPIGINSATYVGYGTYQPFLPQIPKTPSCSCSVQWITSRCSRLASSSSFGTDEQ